MYLYSSRCAHQMSQSNPPLSPLRFTKCGAHTKYRRLSVQVWAQTAILKNTDTIQIKMGALVNQSNAKKLFGARGC